MAQGRLTGPFCGETGSEMQAEAADRGFRVGTRYDQLLEKAPSAGEELIRPRAMTGSFCVVQL